MLQEKTIAFIPVILEIFIKLWIIQQKESFKSQILIKIKVMLKRCFSNKIYNIRKI